MKINGLKLNGSNIYLRSSVETEIGDTPVHSISSSVNSIRNFHDTTSLPRLLNRLAADHGYGISSPDCYPDECGFKWASNTPLGLFIVHIGTISYWTIDRRIYWCDSDDNQTRWDGLGWGHHSNNIGCYSCEKSKTIS